MKKKDEKLEAFLKDYKALMLKHNASIGACGCCNSPWYIPWGDEEITEEDIEPVLQHLRDEY